MSSLELPLVGLREREQVVDRPAHPVDLLVHAHEDPARRRREVAAQAHVELRAHHGERRAEVVRGVGDQALLLRDAVLQAVEHRVERHGQMGELVGAAGHRDPLAEPVDPDLLGLRRHPLDRAQGLAGEPPAPGGRPGERDGHREEQERQHPLDRVLDGLERLRDREHLPLAEAIDRADDGAEALALLAQIDGDDPRVAGDRVGADLGRRDEAVLRLVTPGGQQPSAGVEDLVRAVARQHRAAVRGEVLQPAGRVLAGERPPGVAHVAVDRGAHVGAELQDHERSERRDDGRQHREVPDGQPGADRESHQGSSTKPEPRTVRMSARPSFLRR